MTIHRKKNATFWQTIQKVANVGAELFSPQREISIFHEIPIPCKLFFK